MSSLPPDPYKILSVSKDAQITEIRSAHRKLVLKCHPDKVQDPTLKAQKQDEFQKVQQAYELLSDEKERSKYDDQVKLAELRKQMQNRANTAAPRASPGKTYEFEIRTNASPDIRTAEPRSSSYKSATSSPSTGRGYGAYSRSWEEESTRGPRIFEAEIRSRQREREGSYSEKVPRRDSEREARDREYAREDKARERERQEMLRERERESQKERERIALQREREERDRDREREREVREARDREARKREKDKERERESDRERRKRREKEERLEKEAKELRRAEKKRLEKLKDKEIKREAEEKKKHSKPYIEHHDDEAVLPPKLEKKKSTSKKHDEKRERSSHREELPIPAPAPAVPVIPQEHYKEQHYNYAASYIEAARAKPGAGLTRSATYHARLQPQMPAVPTPPPAPGQTSAFPVPDEDDARRSSATARARRGSADTVGSTRSKAHKKSREPLEERPIIVDSPLSRHAPQFPKSATTTPAMSSSPPRQDLPRTKTMPIDTNYPRPPAAMSRAQTFSGYPEGSSPRGRSRSRYQSQIEEEESEDEDYDRSPRDRKHRSSKKHRSPERHESSVRRYQVDGGRTKSYSRHVEPEMESYSYYPATTGVRVVESRPSMPAREASYSHSTGKFPMKVKQSKAYDVADVAYSPYYQDQPSYAEPAYGYA